MAKSKYLYEFKVPREIEVEKREETADGAIIKKVKETVDSEFAILNPNRRIIDEAELFFGVKLAEAIKAGLLPRALLAKRFANDSGVLSEFDIKQMSTLRSRLFELSNEVTRLSVRNSTELTEEEKVILENDLNEIVVTQNKLQSYEIAQASLYENTAEVRARNKTIFWYALFLSYIKNDKGEYVPLFPGSTFDDKLEAYDVIEEKSEDYIRAAIERFSYFITFFYYGRAQTAEDFAQLEKTLLGDKKPSLDVDASTEALDKPKIVETPEVTTAEILPATIPISESSSE